MTERDLTLFPAIMSSVTKLYYIYIAIFAVVAMFINWRLLTTPVNVTDLETRYQSSSYVRGDKTDYIISDADYYLIRGLKFVTGTKLTELPPSHPPLAQYLYGTLLYFHLSPFWLSLLSAVGCLLIFSLILQNVFKGFWGLIPLILFSLDPLFRADISDTMLDLPHLFFILSSLYFYLRFRKQPRLITIILSSSLLGLAFATKFFPAGISLLGAIYLSTLLSQNFKLFKQHTLSLIFIAFAFALGHLTFFLHGDPVAFIRFQRYVNSWWAGSPQVPPFIIFDLIFRNRWHTWWGSQAITTVTHWSFTWPIIFFLSLIRLPKNPLHLTLYLHLLITLFLFSFTAVYPRHLLILLPTVYTLPFWDKMKSI